MKSAHPRSPSVPAASDPPRPEPPTLSPPPSTTLLAVTGMSPAVLTETVWALAHEDPPVIPDRVVVITTIAGRQAVERELLGLSPGGSPGEAEPARPSAPPIWEQLRSALLGPEAAHDPRLMLEPLRLITAPNPRTGCADWLEDIRTPADNDAAAEFILDEVRRITANDDTRLIASIAGGRKTMSALLTAALSLLGRRQDRLTHVLVNEPFDHPALRPRFFFPIDPPESHHVFLHRRERVVSSADARLELANVPFVPLRYLFRDQLGRFPGGFLHLVRTAADLVGELSQPLLLGLDAATWTATFDQVPVELTGRDIPFFHFLLQHAEHGGRPFPSHKDAHEPFLRFLEEWAKAHPEVNLDFGGTDWRRTPPAHEDIRKRLLSLRDRLRAAGLGHLVIRLLPPRGPVGFPVESVSFADESKVARPNQVGTPNPAKHGGSRPERQSPARQPVAPSARRAIARKRPAPIPDEPGRDLSPDLRTGRQRVRKPEG